jgi:hypothetical protein
MTDSRAGRPLGNSACRSASRLTTAAAPSREARRVRAAVRRRPLAAALTLRRLLVRALLAPATPWARLRWAPSEAARVNVFPHSGQVSSPADCACCSLVARVLLVVRRGRAMRFLSAGGLVDVGRHRGFNQFKTIDLLVQRMVDDNGDCRAISSVGDAFRDVARSIRELGLDDRQLLVTA